MLCVSALYMGVWLRKRNTVCRISNCGLALGLPFSLNTWLYAAAVRRARLQFWLLVQSWYHRSRHIHTRTHTHTRGCSLPDKDTIRLPVSNNRAC